MGPVLANSVTGHPALDLAVQEANPAPDGTTGPDTTIDRGRVAAASEMIGPGETNGPDTMIDRGRVAAASEMIGPGETNGPDTMIDRGRVAAASEMIGPGEMTGVAEEIGLATAGRPGRRLVRAHRL